MLDAILEKLVRARNAGDIEVLTMAHVADRMELLRVEPVECAVLPGTAPARNRRPELRLNVAARSR
jgi:hypothetical protein